MTSEELIAYRQDWKRMSPKAYDAFRTHLMDELSLASSTYALAHTTGRPLPRPGLQATLTGLALTSDSSVNVYSDLRVGKTTLLQTTLPWLEAVGTVVHFDCSTPDKLRRSFTSLLKARLSFLFAKEDDPLFRACIDAIEHLRQKTVLVYDGIRDTAHARSLRDRGIFPLSTSTTVIYVSKEPLVGDVAPRHYLHVPSLTADEAFDVMNMILCAESPAKVEAVRRLSLRAGKPRLPPDLRMLSFAFQQRDVLKFLHMFKDAPGTVDDELDCLLKTMHAHALAESIVSKCVEPVDEEKLAVVLAAVDAVEHLDLATYSVEKLVGLFGLAPTDAEKIFEDLH